MAPHAEAAFPFILFLIIWRLQRRKAKMGAK
jgi:hypothetical protein